MAKRMFTQSNRYRKTERIFI